MITAITILHILASIALVMIVLLQAGKGAEMGAAFGGASQTLFGSAGAMGFLSKLTIAAATVFMCTCLILAFSSTKRASTVIQEKPAATAPATTEKAEAKPSEAPAATEKTPAPESKK